MYCIRFALPLHNNGKSGTRNLFQSQLVHDYKCTVMLKFLSIIFIILFIIPFILRGLLRFIFGSRPQQNNSSQQKRSSSTHTQQQPQKKKVIDKDEGEYIDYEEIKE